MVVFVVIMHKLELEENARYFNYKDHTSIDKLVMVFSDCLVYIIIIILCLVKQCRHPAHVIPWMLGMVF